MKLLPSLSRMHRRAVGARRFQRGFIRLAMFLPRWGASKFDPRGLFRAGEQGAWYEPSDFSTLYQDSAGTTPVTAVGQPVGMVLDKRLGAVRGAELVPDGSFASGAGAWVSGFGGGTVVASGGGLLVTNVGANVGRAVRVISTIPGQWYEVTGRVISRTATTSRLAVSTSSDGTGEAVLQDVGGGATVPGPARGLFRATTATSYVALINQSPISGGVNTLWDDISVREIPGTHATQATAASRPTLSARVNLLTKTAAFADAAWATSTCTALDGQTAYDGTPVATKLTYSANFGYIRQSLGSVAGTTVNVGTIDIKAGSIVGDMQLWLGDATSTNGVACRVSTTTGVVSAALNGGTGAGVSATVQSLGGGWWRVTLQGSMGTTGGLWFMVSNQTATGDFYVARPDLRTAADAALAIPAYQKVNTATDYDTNGFPFREDFDGVDDSRTSATGGGSTTGFFYCAAIKVNGGAGTTRTLWSDGGTNAGLRVRITGSNKLALAGGDGASLVTLSSTDSVDVGNTYVLTAWHDGSTMRVQVNQGAVGSTALTLVAGTAGFTEGKDNGAATSFFNGGIYSRVYRAGPPPDAATIARLQRYIGRKAGLSL